MTEFFAFNPQHKAELNQHYIESKILDIKSEHLSKIKENKALTKV